MANGPLWVNVPAEPKSDIIFELSVLPHSPSNPLVFSKNSENFEKIQWVKPSPKPTIIVRNA